MAAGDRRAGHIPAPEAFLDAGEVGIGAEGRPAPGSEVEGPAPGAVVEAGIGLGRANLGKQVVGPEATTAGDGDEVLREDVERLVERDARLDDPLGYSASRRGAFDELEGVGRHTDQSPRGAGGMAAPPGPLEEPADSLRAPHLQHLLHRPEVDAEIEARRRHDTLHPPAAQGRLGAGAQFPIDRAVVERQRLFPFGPSHTDRIVPAFCLGAGVGKHERR